MKKIFSLFAIFSMAVALNAQILKVYKGSELIDSFTFTEEDNFVFEEFNKVTNIKLSATSAELEIYKTLQLTATVSPSDATVSAVSWSSDNTTVATVSNTGFVTAQSLGTAVITATATDGSGIAASCTITVKQEFEPEYVDLGLSVKWATCNVGASKPEEYGDYFAWGETTGYNSGKTNFSWSTYKWCNGNYNTMTKYCTSSTYGTVDNKTILDPEDDAATANWGGDWRMPTSAELQELLNNCTWSWTQENGVNGYRVTSNKVGYTDKSIFLPAAGGRGSGSLYYAGSSGDYWSSSLYTDNSYIAWCLSFYSGNRYMDDNYRGSGRSVRAVCP